MVIETKVVLGWLKLQLWMWLVDLNCNFERDWLIEMSDNKLCDDNLASEEFFKTWTIEGIIMVTGKGKIKRGASKLWQKVKKCGERWFTFLISFDTKKLALRNVRIWEEGIWNRRKTTFLEKIKLLGKQKIIMMTSWIKKPWTTSSDYKSIFSISVIYNETRIVFAEFDASLRKWIKGENQTKRWQSQ